MSQNKGNQASLILLVLCAFLLLLPAAVLAAGGGHADSGVLIKDFLYRIFNFTLMVGLLVYFVAKPMRNGLRARREAIEKMLADAQEARDAAEAKHREYSDKLARATEEIAQIRVAIKREGEMERDRILLSARELATKIEQEAENKAAGVVTKARVELREEAARLAVKLAAEFLQKQVNASDQQRLVDEYMQKVGELH